MSKALIDSDISLHEFVLLKNMLVEYNNIKKKYEILRAYKYDWYNKRKNF